MNTKTRLGGGIPFLYAMMAAGAMLLLPKASGQVVIQPDNLLVSVTEFTGFASPPTYVGVYSTSGTRLGVLANIPEPGGTGVNSEQARDLVSGPGSEIYVYDGTFNPYLARYDVATGTWTQQTYPGWSTANDITAGGLTRLGNYIYAADMATANGGEAQGIVRFDVGNATVDRFATSIQPNDVTLGLDNVLYAFDGAGSPISTVYKYDPITETLLGTVSVPTADYRALGAAADGSMYLADFNGNITHVAPNGTVIKSVHVSSTRFDDVDINVNGTIALGTADGNVVMTDLSLNTTTKFTVSQSGMGGEVFTSWTSIPEPSVAPLVGGLVCAGVLCARRRFKKKPAGEA